MPEYLKVDGHDLYCYEWENDGEAVVLLHGGLSQTAHWASSIVPALEDYHVFAYDRSSHGFTAYREESINFTYQLREAIAYLENVVKEPAHIVGWSDGGIIGLMVAIQRPDLVKSLVAIGANFHYNGTVPSFDMGPISDEDRAEYAIYSPDSAETLDRIHAHFHTMWKSEPDIPVSDLKKIQCPVLVMAGDDDVIRHAHTIELFETLPLGQLAIVPGTSHILPKEKPGLVNLIITEFLEDLSYPITRMPMRRTNPVSNQPE
jgi:pimeloyl-ACP methyl ester carboxylesterase